MRVYVKYQLKTLEPVKMAASGTQQGQELSKNYIAGSSIRGALIGEYLKRKDVEKAIDCTPFLREQFLTDTIFLNAYITTKDGDGQEQICVPVPSCYVADKHDIRSADDTHLLVNNQIYNSNAEGESVGRNRYCYVKKNNLHIVDVKMVANLHIQKSKNLEDGKMFRYEAIDKEQLFTGFIQCKEEYAQNFVELLNKPYLYIGGSKGSGYGKCEIVGTSKIISVNEYNELVTFGRTSQRGKLYIYTMSDWILYNEKGMVTNAVSEKYLQEMLHIENVKLVKANVATSQTSGYNHKHKAHSVQQISVKAGSVYEYEYDFQNEIRNEDIRRLEEKGVGQRKTEGYGRILIQPDLHQEYCILKEKDTAHCVLEPKSKNVNDKESKDILKDIQEKIINQRMYDHIVYEYSYKKMQELKAHYRWKMTKTQANQLHEVLDRICFLKNSMEDSQWEELSKAELKRYLEKHKKNSGLEITKITDEPLSLYSILEDMSQRDTKKRITDMDHFIIMETKNIFDEKERSDRNNLFDLCLYLKSLVYYFIREDVDNE